MLMATNTDSITDAVNSDPAALEQRAGASGRMLIKAVDRAAHMQSGAIVKYVEWLRAGNPDASPSEIQKMMDKHLKRLAMGSGAGAGAAAAIPGIGFVTGAAAVGAESLVFLDAATLYVMASAYLRGVDIHDEERRRALILVVLLGSAGTLIVDAAVGDLNKKNGAPRLKDVNSKLTAAAVKRMGKKFKAAWLGKLLPLGVGAVVGTFANRTLAHKVISNARTSLGPLPAEF